MQDDITISSIRVGIYTRLSHDDGDLNVKESESITNQKDFLINYTLEHNWCLAKIYTDDGYSGTNFERPGFSQMLQDIENNIINVVITKDLSRLGRNYSMTGYYIDEYFPEHQIRYIAVNDNIDTFENEDNSISAFLGVVNDLYAKDTSKKIRTTFRLKQKKGEYLGTSPPFGYNKDKEQKGKLVIDPYSFIYVKRIFNEFLSGKTIHNITLDLTEDGISTPSAYRNIKNTQKIVKGAWNDVTIRRILKNEVYIGHTIQNKKQKVNYKIKKQRPLPKSEWIKKEHTHEPIIALKDFQIVQQILENRSYIPKKGATHLLTGFLFCNHCGSRVTYLKRHEKGKFYCICNVAKNYRKLGKCDMICIKEEEIEEQLKKFLQEISTNYLNHDNMIQKTYMKQVQEILLNKIREKQFIEGNIQENNNIEYELYKDKITHKITKDLYHSLQLHTNEDKEKFEKQLQIIKQEISSLENMKQNDKIISHVLKKFLSFRVLDRNILSILIDKILVYRNDSGENTLKIYCKFQIPK